MTTTTFHTANYVWTHGRSPRGRGTWAFSLKGTPARGDGSEIMWTPSMTYSEAKKYLLAKFPGCKGRDIEVLT